MSPAERRRYERESIVHGALYGVREYVPGVLDASLTALLAAIIQLHREGVLTEGQTSRATRLDRVVIRTLVDRFEERDAEIKAPPHSTTERG